MAKSPGRVLKDKGLIPSSWNLRNLSRGQKSWITKQEKTFSAVIKNPKNFSTVSAKSKKHREQAKVSGFKVSNGRAVIYNPGGERARRVGDTIRVSTKSGYREYFYIGADDYIAKLRELHSIELKKNQVWGLALDGYELNVYFTSLGDLERYVSRIHREQPSKAKYAQVVLITEKDGLFGHEDN